MGRYRDLLERYVASYNAGDLDGVMDQYAEDAVQLMPDLYYDNLSVVAQLGLTPQGVDTTKEEPWDISRSTRTCRRDRVRRS